MARPWTAYVRAKRCYDESQGGGQNPCIAWSPSQSRMGMWGDELFRPGTRKAMALTRASRYQSSSGAHCLPGTR